MFLILFGRGATDYTTGRSARRPADSAPRQEGRGYPWYPWYTCTTCMIAPFSAHDPRWRDRPEGQPRRRMTEYQVDHRTAEDNDLVAKSQNGDLDAYNQLVVKHQRGVYNLALRMLGAPSAAEDIAQEAFLSAWRNIRRFRGGNFSAWLLRIATNACYDQIRRRQRHPTGSLETVLGDEDSPAEFPDAAELPEDRAVRGELARAIGAGLLTIQPDQRAAVVLVDIQGRAYDEVAAILDVPIGTVKSRLSRGRAALRAYFLQRPELLPERFRSSSEDLS